MKGIGRLIATQIGKLSFNTPATGHRPVMLHPQEARPEDLGPKKSKRQQRRSNAKKGISK